MTEDREPFQREHDPPRQSTMLEQLCAAAWNSQFAQDGPFAVDWVHGYIPDATRRRCENATRAVLAKLKTVLPLNCAEERVRAETDAANRERAQDLVKSIKGFSDSFVEGCFVGEFVEVRAEERAGVNAALDAIIAEGDANG